MDEHCTPFNFGPPMAHNVAQAVRTLVRVLSSVSAYRVAIASQYHRRNFCKSIARCKLEIQVPLERRETRKPNPVRVQRAGVRPAVCQRPHAWRELRGSCRLRMIVSLEQCGILEWFVSRFREDSRR